MKIDLDKYKIVSKILIGTNLKIVFQNINDDKDLKVLELKNLVGFLDSITADRRIKVLRLEEDGGGSYSFDLSLRLDKPEIENYSQVFIFIDENCTDFCFRAVAKLIEFRDWKINDNFL